MKFFHAAALDQLDLTNIISQALTFFTSLRDFLTNDVLDNTTFSTIIFIIFPFSALFLPLSNLAPEIGGIPFSICPDNLLSNLTERRLNFKLWIHKSISSFAAEPNSSYHYVRALHGVTIPISFNSINTYTLSVDCNTFLDTEH